MSYLLWALQEAASLTEYLGVARRVALFLARESAQPTVDHLAYEMSLQVGFGPAGFALRAGLALRA